MERKTMVLVTPGIVPAHFTPNGELGIANALDVLARNGVGCIVIQGRLRVIVLDDVLAIDLYGDLDAGDLVQHRHWRPGTDTP